MVRMLADPARNAFFSDLGIADQALLLPRFFRVHLHTGQVIDRAGEPIAYVYFPEDAIISLTSDMGGREGPDVALIGFEGMSDISLAMGNQHSLYTKIVRVSGIAWRLPAEALVTAMNESETLRPRLLRYAATLRFQVSAAAVATAHLKLDSRLARLLLMLADRTRGEVIRATHETLAAALGATRPAVTTSCSELDAQKLIVSRRAKFRILDRHGLSNLAGELYGEPEREFARLMRSPELHGHSFKPIAS